MADAPAARPVIIDTDPGVDDAMAITFAALHPDIELLGLTTVFGNAHVDTCTTNAANQAYEMAGVGPRDLDLIELHDCFATAELMHYENMGLCPRGEAGRLIDDGDTWAGGRIPVNLSGGLLSKGHPIGATGIANIHELTLHLRGEAGARQQAGARLGLAHVIGLGSCCAIHILEAPNK